MKLSLNSLLAKAAEYGLPLQREEQSNATLLNKAITDHEYEQNELSIRTAVEAIRDEEIEEIKRIAGVRESIGGIVSRRLLTCAYPNIADHIKDKRALLLDKAWKYRLKYNPEDITWAKLEDSIEEIESLIKEAEEYGIYDYDVQDLTDLRQKIEDAQHKAEKENRSARNEYLASIL